jgi:hypothetical protein
MSEQKSHSVLDAPAMPVPMAGDWPECDRGMTARQLAAITLRVPTSGVPALDDMIREARRMDFAAQATQGLLSSGRHIVDDETATEAVGMADCVMYVLSKLAAAPAPSPAAMSLLERVAGWLEGQAPDSTWWKDYFALTGDHMILTDEGWESGAGKAAYIAEDADWKPLDEVNAPQAIASQPASPDADQMAAREFQADHAPVLAGRIGEMRTEIDGLTRQRDDLIAAAHDVIEWNGYGDRERTGIWAWDNLIDAIAKADGAEPATPAPSPVNADLYRELCHLVRLLEPLEKSGELNVPGLATLNGAREAIRAAKPR